MRLLPSIAAALLATGCSNLEIRLGERVDPERCDAFEAGRTSRAEMLDALGPPSALARHGDGVALLYEFVQLEERQLGISLERVRGFLSLVLGSGLGLPRFNLIKISLGRSSSEREALVAVFDAAGVLQGYGVTRWEQVMGKGGAAQFLVSVENVVDSEAFLESPRSLTWGLALLEPLPEALNQPHAPDFELRASPINAGQRTLEYADSSKSRRSD